MSITRLARPIAFVIILMGITTFYFTNCLQVVGTGNPKVRPPPNSKMSNFVNHLCTQLATCGMDAGLCDQELVGNYDFARGLDLDVSKHPTVAAASGSELAGTIVIDQASLDSCELDVSKSKCSNENGAQFVSGGRINFKSFVSTLQQSANCRRFALDHLNFKTIKESLFHNLSPYSEPAIETIFGDRMLGILDSKKLELFRINNTVLEPKVSLNFVTAPSSWFWSKSESGVEICTIFYSDLSLRCRKLNSDFVVGEERVVDLGVALGGASVSDVAVLKGSAGPNVILVASSTLNYLISVSNTGIVTKHLFPVGLIYPKKFQRLAVPKESIYLHFPGIGLLDVTLGIQENRNFVNSEIVGLKGDAVQVIWNSKNQRYFLYEVSKVANSVSISSFDPNSKGIRLLSQNTLPGVPEQLASYRLSDNSRGLVVSMVASTKLWFAFEGADSKLTDPILVDAGAPILGFQTLDFDDDGKEDLLLNSQATDTFHLLRKE